MEELVAEWLKKLKNQMKDGIPNVGIPSLDPLVLRDYSFRPFSLGRYGSINMLDFDKLTVNGITDFDIAKIKTSVFRMKLKLNLRLPEIRLEGRYDIDGQLFGFVPIRGSGPFHIEVSEVLITTKSKLKAKKGKFKLRKGDFSLEIGRILIYFHGLFGGGDFGNRINSNIQRIGDVLLEKLGPIINVLFAEFARKAFNEALQHVDFKKLEKNMDQKKE